MTTSFLLISCGGEAGDPDSYRTPTPSPNDGLTFDLNGQFARKSVISQYVESATGDGFEQQSVTSYSVVTLREGTDANTAFYSEVDCLTEMTEVSGSLLTLHQGVYSNSPPIEYLATVSSSKVGATFSIASQVEIKGAELEDPWTEALPTTPDDSRVVDFDQDGNPGYTIYVDSLINGTMWATQRYIFAMNGTLAGFDAITGLNDAVLESTRLWSSSVFIPTDSDTYMDDTPENSFFELIRVADGYTCETLLAEQDALFGT